VDFNNVVDRALDIVDHELEVNHIQVTKTLADDLPPLRLDPNQFEQVLLNLLVNAADAIGPAGGEIYIATELKDVDDRRQVELKISDSGCGIPAGDLDKIFDPFFTTKGEKKGTGLGLAVVWGIIDEHGGSISVQSKPEHGATFTILLPANGHQLPGDEPVSDEQVS
jgi:two-component system NtrC family sensor kinase